MHFLTALAQRPSNASAIDLSQSDAATLASPTLRNALVELGQNKVKAIGTIELAEAIRTTEYAHLGIGVDEIFLSEGASSDMAYLQEIFDADNRIAIVDPSDPLYLDANVMAGRTKQRLKSGSYGGVTYIEASEDNGFLPEPPFVHVDLIYLASPNHPTGIAMNRDLLFRWVAYAKSHEAVILFDSTYRTFVQSKDVPRSIYEIPHAREVAVEVRSIAPIPRLGGLSGSYTVMPKTLIVRDAGMLQSLHTLWQRRHATKIAPPSQTWLHLALSLYDKAGQKECESLVKTIYEDTHQLHKGLVQQGFVVQGGIDSPFLWCRTLQAQDGWAVADALLKQSHLFVTPGAGFGRMGESFVCCSTLGAKGSMQAALKRLRAPS
jgi:LL-diaminopimelate aminotransferase